MDTFLIPVFTKVGSTMASKHVSVHTRVAISLAWNLCAAVHSCALARCLLIVHLDMTLAICWRCVAYLRQGRVRPRRSATLGAPPLQGVSLLREVRLAVQRLLEASTC